eukprot:8188136-Pyramimonas_sp.AAC.1
MARTCAGKRAHWSRHASAVTCWRCFQNFNWRHLNSHSALGSAECRLIAFLDASGMENSPVHSGRCSAQST